MEFLPQDYQMPKSQGSYTKFDDGETKIRILSAAVLGWLDWNENVPIRVKFVAGQPKPTPIDPNRKVKHFWALKVYNYTEARIQVCEINQATIQEAIKNLAFSADWGDPSKYDITITKSGSGMDTKYAVMPSPKSELSEQAKEAFVSTNVNLEALFTGEDPFAAEAEEAPEASPAEGVAQEVQPGKVESQSPSIDEALGDKAPDWVTEQQG